MDTSRSRAHCIPPPAPIPREYADAALIERVVRNARAPVWRQRPRWHVVKRRFAIGSAAARALCRRFDLDPDELV